MKIQRNKILRRLLPQQEDTSQEDLNCFDHHHRQECLKQETLQPISSQDDHLPGAQEPGTWLDTPVTCRDCPPASSSCSGEGACSLLAGGTSLRAGKGFRGPAGGSARGRGNEITANITARGATSAGLPRSTFCATTTDVKTTSPGTGDQR